MYFEEITVNDFLTLKRKMVDFSIRDLEDISLFLFPFIILTTNEKGFNFRNFNKIYKFEAEEVIDFRNKERFNIKDYYKSLVRDKKIDDLFKDES